MINEQEVTFLVFALARMSGCVFFSPIFARKNIPAILKASMAATLAIFIAMVCPQDVAMPQSVIEYGLLLAKELFFGFVIGFVCSLFAQIIILGGELIDYQIGIAMAKVFDPQTNMNIALSAGFYNIVYMLLFLGLNGHIALIKVFLDSTIILPFGKIVVTQQLYAYILDLFCDTTVLAVKFSLPIVMVGLVVELGVGILTKLIPQINIFVLNIQIKLLVGLLGMALLFYPLANFLEQSIIDLFAAIQAGLSFMT